MLKIRFIKIVFKLKKVWRYSRIYGFKRTLVKSFGRMRVNKSLSYLLMPTMVIKKSKIALIGCGQFGFTTISYFLNSYSPFKIYKVFDINRDNAKTLATFYGCEFVDEVEEISCPEVKVIYIASNHATHTKYALMAINKGVDVYIEKPISVTEEQLLELETAYRLSSVNVFCGYNRPFSSAIKKVKQDIDNFSPLMVSIFVVGHFIDVGHWYRKPEEGTRVCGNLGHWIDLCIHLLNQSNVSEFDIAITYSDERMPDDNLVVVFKSPRGDVFSLILTSYSEPFEGIEETILIHQKDYQVHIDDFRRASFQKHDQREDIKYKPKDVGHKEAILQPFKQDTARDFEEVIRSTRLMLYVKNMVLKKAKTGHFNWRKI